MDLATFVIELRHIRFLGLSSFELLLIVLIGIVAIPKKLESWSKYLLVVFITGIFVHWLFNIHTQLNWQLGLSECPPNFDSLYGTECPPNYT
jgi:hypothetical protein